MAENAKQSTIGECLGCHYSLEGLSEGICPECGRKFDPRDPATMYFGRVPGAVGLFFLGAPGWLMIVLTFSTAVVSFYSNSVPGGRFGISIMLLFAWFMLGSLWLIRVLGRVVCGMKHHVPVKGLKELSRWLAQPAIVVVAFALLVLNIPFRACFAMNRSSMERFAIQSMTASGSATHEQFGPYSCTIRMADGGVLFEVSDAGFLSSEGFAYMPNGVPNSSYSRYYEPLDGPWYWFTEDW